MENLLEILVPLIFAAVYFFGNLLSNKSGDDEASPPKLPHQPGGSGEAEDYAERQRQIQEAIRRKIMERRQAAAEQQAPVSESPVVARREPHKEVREQRKEVQQRNVPKTEPAPAPPATADKPSGAFSWDTSDNVYEQQMQHRLEQIEASKRRAEVLRQQAGMKPAAATPTTRGAVAERRARRTSGGLLSGPVRKVLRDPAAARVGFIYGEVLGKPVSLRKSGSGVAD